MQCEESETGRQHAQPEQEVVPPTAAQTFDKPTESLEEYNRSGCSSPVDISRTLCDQIEEAAVAEQVPERIDGEYGDASLLGEGRKEEGEDGESEEAQVRAAGSGGSVIGEERQ